ncbi:MAG: aldo/keto reductase [Spirochaetales bacterium]|nr:aldo/keto reductase [Spirochaetales bacterium]
MNTLQLQSGNAIPQLGLGTWELTGSTCEKTVKEAIAMGYTHIDTADGYGNHKEVGRGVHDSGAKRENLFITTKIKKNAQKEAQVLAFGDRMRKELNTDYVDLLLIHWPTKNVPFEETFTAMHTLVEKGYARSIGISNFNTDLVKKAAHISPLPVATNQVEFHPLLFQKELLNTCESLGIRITAYSPLGKGEALQHPVIRDIAGAKGVSAAQVCIAWLMAKGIIAIPKARGKEHLESNLKAAELTLLSGEITAIDGIQEQKRIIEAEGWREFDF